MALGFLTWSLELRDSLRRDEQRLILRTRLGFGDAPGSALRRELEH